MKIKIIEDKKLASNVDVDQYWLLSIVAQALKSSSLSTLSTKVIYWKFTTNKPRSNSDYRIFYVQALQLLTASAKAIYWELKTSKLSINVEY